MRDLKCQAGAGNVVAAVVAVLEKQSSVVREIYDDGSFRGNCPIEVVDATQSAAKNKDAALETGAFYGVSKEDESFRSAVEDFDSVAEDVRKNFVKTGSLRRKKEALEVDVGEVDGAFRIERTHSLKSIRTNPYVSSQDYTRSLGRQQQNRNTDSASSLSSHFSNYSWTPNPIAAGHGSRFRPMPSRPEQLDLDSREFEEDTNIEQDSGSYHLRRHEDADYRRLSGTDSSTTEGLTSSGGSSSSSSADSSDSEDDSDVARDHVMVKGLETIAEEDRFTPCSLRSSKRDPEENESSSSEEAAADDTKDRRTIGWSENGSTAGSTSDLSSANSLEGGKSLKDSSTRCNSDFQWIAKETSANDAKLPIKMDVQTPPSPTATKPPINRGNAREKTSRKDRAPGSLDRRRHHNQNRQDRDQKSRSTHVNSPCRPEEFQPCQSWCCSPQDSPSFDHFHRRHERSDPQKYGSNPMLLDQRGSHPDIYGDMNRCRHDMMGCCSYHMAPPPCYFYGDRGYRWTPPPYSKPGEQDEKLRKLQFEKDNLHLQVQVLTDQIEAQSYKISDLEKTLQDKKHCLVEAEEKLQREMLSRSSLETQKLELMSIISDLKLQQAAVERENMELRNNLHMNNNGDLKKPALLPRNPQPQAALTPSQHSNSGQGNSLRVSPSPSPISSLNSTRRSDTNYSLQDVQPPKTPPSSYKRQIDIHYASLPRQQFLSNGGAISSSVDFNANPSMNGGKKAVAFAQTEKGSEETNGDASQLQIGKSKGIKKIFGKIKRSGSGNLEDLPGVGEFQRGGVRATAAARLGWSEPQLTQKPDKPFSEWDTENICDWLQDLGLDQYIPEARKWVKNGQQLQECAIAEIEKELNIKNSLHKKKLQLALIDAEENGSSDPYLRKAGELDTAWVLRWLDDVGLPQHKESFLINRVDGRVLHRLTVDDLGVLHVTSLLHVASIKRGIQVLRENEYSAACLKRRSAPDEGPPTPKQVSLWTTHRVMEWLRAVDLAEYAPNLRGAGVHGGLIVHETKFTAELLASLLSIPPGKTLLRRHLNTHFKELLGRDIIQEKREAQSTMGYIPLTPTAKLKSTKKSQFSLKRKKSKGEADYGDLVCPLNPEKQSGEMNGSALNSSMGQMRRINQEEEDVYHLADKGAKSLPASVTNSPIPFRNAKQ
ncbi:uncharacterized protein LOC123309066 isoform X3 [Coccinella septempunctata]|uniref:uncharacterized protein LOC123309066 isoform X3 n=1 Tax=Coccinella septempunctata TaxID=41139 RepID=UPI001D089448|nr:uncharacterized protein LOC123309066 isoform X3 [Coccinella septempunctata]